MGHPGHSTGNRSTPRMRGLRKSPVRFHEALAVSVAGGAFTTGIARRAQRFPSAALAYPDAVA